jgi:hypothetical protein
MIRIPLFLPLLPSLLLALALPACAGPSATLLDASHGDGAAEGDASLADAPTRDAYVPDAGPFDAGPPPPPPTGPLGLSDVSTLFPLPSSLAASSLLALDAEGNGGPLLDAARFAEIPVFRPDAAGAGGDSGPLDYGVFRVVAARVDPCFPSLALLESDPSACRRQMRLVAQPIREEGGVVYAADSAIHLLFDLTEPQFTAMIDELLAMRGARAFDPTEVLDVHPVLADEGDDGPFGAMVRAWILRHAGTATLSQVTFVRGDENFVWQFGGFRVQSDGSLLPIEIDGLHVAPGDAIDVQRLRFNFGPTSPSPATDLSDGIASLFGIPAGTRDMPYWVYPSEPEVHAGLEAAFRIESPREVDADHADCVTCHLAGPVRIRAESMGHTSEGRLRFRSGWDLSLSSDDAVLGRPNRIRAFGYSREGATISQRTVNESAAVADALNAMLAP